MTVFNICWLRLSPPPGDLTRIYHVRIDEEVWTFSAPLVSIWLPPGRGEGERERTDPKSLIAWIVVQSSGDGRRNA